MSDEASDPPSEPTAASPSPALEAGGSPEVIGDRIGSFRLLEMIGEGGFGRVWKAERDEPFRQIVALKILLPSAHRQGFAERFHQERQALALLDHPGIVKVLEGGTTAGGLPYFAMEFVDGQPITTFCDRKRLELSRRLDVFVKVCDAVQHAHQRGILHRDLSPRNILVTEDSNGQIRPVVIDFGIAKVFAHHLIERDVQGEPSLVMGTPPYMSPEQAERAEKEIGVTSDVYSLGVILYELLVGTAPFSPKTLREIGRGAIGRYLRDQVPPSPDTRLLELGEDRERVAKRRGLRIPELLAAVRGELGWIPLKAIRPERTDRYRGAAELADDIRNWLEGRPLLAGPQTDWYRIRKFVARRRGPFLAGAAVAASIVLALAVSLVSLAEAREQRDLAERRAQETEAVLDFQHRQLSDVAQASAGPALFGAIERLYSASRELAGADPGTAREEARRLASDLERVNPTDVAFSFIREEVLERSTLMVERLHASDPGLQAALYLSLGKTYVKLAEYEEARRLFDRATALRMRVHGADARATLEARRWTILVDSILAPDRTVETAGSLVADASSILGPDDELTMAARGSFAFALAGTGNVRDAVAEFRRLESSRPSGQPLDAPAIEQLLLLGDLLRVNGELVEGERTLLAAEAAIRSLRPAEPRLEADLGYFLGILWTSRGMPPDRTATGARLLLESLELTERVDGEEHDRSFDARSAAADRLADLAGRVEEAGRLHRRSLAIARGRPYPSDASLVARCNYAVWLMRPPPHGEAGPRAEEVEEAVRSAEEAHRIMVARRGFSDDGNLQVLAAIASLHDRLGRPARAEQLLRQVIALRVTQSGFPAYLLQNLQCDLATAVAGQGRWPESIEILSAAQGAAERDLPADSDGRWTTARRLLAFLEQWDSLSPDPQRTDRIAIQRAVVEELCAARSAAGKPCIDLFPTRVRIAGPERGTSDASRLRAGTDPPVSREIMP